MWLTNRKMIASNINYFGFLLIIFLLPSTNTSAITFYSEYGISRNWTVYPAPGTHSFEVNGIGMNMYTEWYVNGVYKRTDNSGVLATDPNYSYAFTSGTVEIKAIVYTGSWVVKETHIWTANVLQPPNISTTSNITQTSFIANWVSANGATKYYIDVSTNSSFSSFVAGYNNKDVGASTSTSVMGLTTNSTYYFRVRSNNSSGTSNNSSTQAVQTLSTQPTINISVSFLDFGTIPTNTTSSLKMYTVSGSNLIGNITINSSTAFQISTSPTGPFSNTITLNQSGGNVNNTTIYVRFFPTEPIVYNGILTHSSLGAISKNITTTGIGISNYIISGTIRQKNWPQRPIAGFTIRATNTVNSSQFFNSQPSSENGSFIIANVPNGSYILSVLNADDYNITFNPSNPLTINGSNVGDRNIELSGKAIPQVRIVAPETFSSGTAFDLDVYLKNVNSAVSTLKAYLDISFPDNPTVLVQNSTGWNSVTIYNPGQTIHHATNGQMSAVDRLVSGEWSGIIGNLQEKKITLRITPAPNATSIKIYYRGTIEDVCDPVTLGSGGGIRDQQGWVVYEKIITATGGDGSLIATMKNIDGTSTPLPSSNGKVKLYSQNFTLLGEQTTNSSGVATFPNVNYGIYNMGFYYMPSSPGTVFGQEYWGNFSNIAHNSNQTPIIFQRNMPYSYSYKIYDNTTGEEVTGDTVFAGTQIKIDVYSKNPNVNQKTIKARLLFDQNKAAPYDFEQTTAATVIAGNNGTIIHTFYYAPTREGDYYGVIGTQTEEGGYVYTDGWAWEGSPQNKWVSVKSTSTGGTINVTVQNIDGTSQPLPGANAIVKRYSTGWTYYDQQYTDQNGIATFQNIGYGTYNFKIIHSPSAPSTIFGEEVWGIKSEITHNQTQTNVSFRRDMPYSFSYKVYDNSNGVDLTGGTITAGTQLRIEVKTKNPSLFSKTVKAHLVLDNDKITPYGLNQISAESIIPGNNDSATFVFYFAPSDTGKWWGVVGTQTEDNDYVYTDGWAWPDEESKKWFTVQPGGSIGGNIFVKVSNYDGNSFPAPGISGIVQRFTPDWTFYDQQNTANSGLAVFSGIPQGIYNFKILHSPANTPAGFDDQLWGYKPNISHNTDSTFVGFQREMPYAYSFSVFNNQTGADVTGGLITAGTQLRFEIKIKNPNLEGKNVKARIVFDQNKITPYNYDQVSSVHTINGGNDSIVISFYYAPSLSGDWWGAVGLLTEDSIFVYTDGWSWDSQGNSKWITVQGNSSGGNLVLNIKNYDSTSIPFPSANGKVKRYGIDWTMYDEAFTNYSGVAFFPLASYGTYNFKIYHNSNQTVFGEELWGYIRDLTHNNLSTEIVFYRQLPYATSLRLFIRSTGEEVTGDSIPAGTELKAIIEVQNPGIIGREVKSRLILDYDKLLPYDYNLISSEKYIAGNNSKSQYEFIFTPTLVGNLWSTLGVLVEDGGYTYTDGWAWGNGPMLIVNDSLQAPQITIIQPNGGNLLSAETVYQIKWSTKSVNHVRIDYTTNAGVEWRLIADSVSAAEGSFNWLVPRSITNQCKIRISSLENDLIYDISDSLFSIVPYNIKLGLSIFRNSALTRYGEFIAITDTVLATSPSVTLRYGGNEKPIIMNRLSNNQFVYTGDFKFDSTGIYEFRVKVVGFSGITIDTTRQYSVLISKPGKSGTLISLDNKAEFFISNKLSFDELVLHADMEYEEGEAVYSFSPEYDLLEEQKITLKYDKKLALDESKLFICRYSNGGWQRLNTTVYPNISEAVAYTQNSGKFKLAVDMSSAENNLVPSEYALGQNYPNPFNPSTTINVKLPKDGFVKIVIYDMLGRRIKTLVDTYSHAGNYSYIWDATADDGQPVSTGTYIYVLSSADFSDSRKLLIIK